MLSVVPAQSLGYTAKKIAGLVY